MKILGKIGVRRISNSDLVEIDYSSEDPGICQNTLVILSEVFVASYAEMKVNQSDAVVKYFNQQLVISSKRLSDAEDELLEFNRSNNIINYYEQTKHIASQKEHFEMEYQTVQMNYEATKSVIQVLESKMSSRQKLRVASEDVLELRNRISEKNNKPTSVISMNMKKGFSKGSGRCINKFDFFSYISKYFYLLLQSKPHRRQSRHILLRKYDHLLKWQHLKRLLLHEALRSPIFAGVGRPRLIMA